MTDSAPTAALVSIIVPVYNSERYLHACATSILAQTHRNIEVLLIDDGSTDGSGAICDALESSDPRVVVVHQANGGIASAQNRGLDMARGEFITFCDNDDLMRPHLVERLVGMLESEKADMSCCRWVNVGASGASQELARTVTGATGKTISFDNPARSYQMVFSKLVRRLFRRELMYFSEANWGKLYRAELFQGIRFPEGRFAQDVAVAMDLYLRMTSVASCSDDLYLWLQRGDSVSHQLRSTSYYHDIILAHGRCFELSLEAGILPARAYYGLSAIRFARASALSADDQLLCQNDEAYIRSLKRRLSVPQRFVCAMLATVRRCETWVYDRTVHRRS
ncbi:glycosyltransferase family 2 protein [Microbacterium sp. SLBN-146]|uniref:glycosyltransferase family 2 protein n=1 Tax=Microbacterium sp. SLBN-146 TaxID=2768457 RepID=UPI00114EC0A5|nr:glycosyltransferase family 2 protein [Microbacterium sp. SLBN-146]TQJ32722.1 glycosyltransferase involved in cell wall biosynthesis [Microbacterium sp. SLBN-146]